MSMTLADAIINGDQEIVIKLLETEDINDLDEYGFTPLIETVIVNNIELAELLLARNVDVDKGDVSGRSALHWAADLGHLSFCELLLAHGADPNAYNRGGQPVLVHPLLRQNTAIKDLLCRHGGKLSFARDFINTKLLGHRYQLKGDVDIINAHGEFIELDFEGFVLEFSLDIIQNSLRQYKNHFAARDLRPHFQYLDRIIDMFTVASRLLKYQDNVTDLARHDRDINELLQQELLLLPVAYRGHAVTFIKCGRLLAKCDRGENSQREGTVNIYLINDQQTLDTAFLKDLIYKRQTQKFIHHYLNDMLALRPIAKLPLSPQESGNCSWANVEAVVPTAYFLLLLNEQGIGSIGKGHADVEKQVFALYEHWAKWDKDRALYNCIQSFDYADSAGKASIVSILAAVLFQHCDYRRAEDMVWAERILKVLTEPDYIYILYSYIKTYCTKRLTIQGNNLLHVLDDCGIEIPDNIHPYPLAGGQASS